MSGSGTERMARGGRTTSEAEGEALEASAHRRRVGMMRDRPAVLGIAGGTAETTAWRTRAALAGPEAATDALEQVDAHSVALVASTRTGPR